MLKELKLRPLLDEFVVDMEPEDLIKNPHVKKLVEALEFIAKPHIGMSGIPVNKNGAFCVEHAKEALEKWENKND